MPDVELRPAPANGAPGPQRCYCCDEPPDRCVKRRPCIGCKLPTFPFETSTPGYCPRCVSAPGTYELVDVDVGRQDVLVDVEGVVDVGIDGA